VLALGVGIIIGALLHRARALRDTLDPLFATYYAVPVFAFYPFFIVVFGLGGSAAGPDRFHARRRRGDRQYAERARPRTASAAQDRADHADVPGRHRAADDAAVRRPLPPDGAKLAVAYAFIGVIGSEFIMSRGGIGYEISFAYANFDNATMYPLIVLILLASGCHQRRAVALGTAASRPAGDADEGCSPGAGCATRLVLIVALVVIWQGSIGGSATSPPRIAARRPLPTRRSSSPANPSTRTSSIRCGHSAIAYTLSVVIGLVVGFWLGFDRYRATR
jgi:ABC-type nitrate/sulfonate/bicarbonate transport system permease component